MNNVQVTKERWDELQKLNQKLTEDLDALLEKHEVTMAQMMIRTKDGVAIDHDFKVGIIDKLGLLELAKINLSTRQSGYVNSVMIQEAMTGQKEREAEKPRLAMAAQEGEGEPARIEVVKPSEPPPAFAAQ